MGGANDDDEGGRDELLELGLDEAPPKPAPKPKPAPPAAVDDADARMLAALSRAVDAELASGGGHVLDVERTVAPAPPSTGVPSALADLTTPPTGMGVGRPKVPPVLVPPPASTTGRHAARPPRAATPPPAAAVDPFAPPGGADGEAELRLDVDDKAIAEVRAAQDPAAARRAPTAGSATRERSAVHGSVRRRQRSSSPVRGWTFALLVLGAAGVAAYRHVTLGYVWRAPAPPPVALEIRTQPPDAELELDGQPMTPNTRVPLGTHHKVVARAPGRIAVRADVPADGTTRLRVRLPGALAKLGAASPSLGSTPSGPLVDLAEVLGEIDRAFGKLEQYERCAARVSEPLTAAVDAYARSTANGLSAEALPVVEQLPGDMVEECKAGIDAARAAPPAIAALDEVAQTLADALGVVDKASRDLAGYYARGDYKVDELKLGRAQHPVLLAAQRDALAAVAAVRRAIGDETTHLQRRELAALKASEGDSRHILLRTAALAARDLALAPASAVAARRASLETAVAAARKLTAGDRASSDLVALIAAPPEGDDATALAAWHDAVVERFSGLVVDLPGPARLR